MKYLKEKVELANGTFMPKLGFGTWQIPNGDSAYNAVKEALEVGYIHIDTAYAYGNEESVGRAIKDSKINREKLFVTSKLASHVKDYDGALMQFRETLANLGLEYLDLYLIHAPWPWNEIGKDCREGNALVWKAMIELYNEGKIKAIGVSNFNKEDIQYIVSKTNFMPHVNQIQYHVGHNQDDTLKYCFDNDILVQAYSPLGTGRILNNEIIVEMAAKYKVTPAQLCIKYCLESKTIPLPKTVNKNRMIENSQVDFELSKADFKNLKNI